MLPVISGNRKRGGLLVTGQETIYHTGDDGDKQAGLNRPYYSVYTTGSQASTTPVNVPHYAGNDVAFVNNNPAADTITSTTIDFTTIFKPADDILFWGSAANSSVKRTIAAAGVAAHTITLTESNVLTNEAAGAYITICKQAAPSNNTVYDELTKLTWLRYTTGGPALKLGTGSDGKLCWYNSSKCYILHALAADLSMDAANKQLKIAGGAAKASEFHTGTLLQFAGFTIANNNRAGGYRCDGVTVSGSDLLLTLWTGYGEDSSQTGTTHNGTNVIDGLTNTSNLRIGMQVTGTNVGTNAVVSAITSPTAITVSVVSGASPSTTTITFTTLATEAAGGSRSIKIVCQSIFAYAAACNAAAVAGSSGWRIPNNIELSSLQKLVSIPVPNTTAFPSWPNDYLWAANTNPTSGYTTEAMFLLPYIYLSYSYTGTFPKTSAFFAELVRS